MSIIDDDDEVSIIVANRTCSNTLCLNLKVGILLIQSKALLMTLGLPKD